MAVSQVLLYGVFQVMSHDSGTYGVD